MRKKYVHRLLAFCFFLVNLVLPSAHLERLSLVLMARLAENSVFVYLEMSLFHIHFWGMMLYVKLLIVPAPIILLLLLLIYYYFLMRTLRIYSYKYVYITYHRVSYTLYHSVSITGSLYLLTNFHPILLFSYLLW